MYFLTIFCRKVFLGPKKSAKLTCQNSKKNWHPTKKMIKSQKVKNPGGLPRQSRKTCPFLALFLGFWFSVFARGEDIETLLLIPKHDIHFAKFGILTFFRFLGLAGFFWWGRFFWPAPEIFQIWISKRFLWNNVHRELITIYKTIFVLKIEAPNWKFGSCWILNVSKTFKTLVLVFNINIRTYIKRILSQNSLVCI